MIMRHVFDAVREGDYKKFMLFYKKDVNEVNKYTKLNLLQSVVCRNSNLKDRLKIIKFLLRKKVDVNYVSTDEKRNVLHYLFLSFREGDVKFYTEVMKLLVKAKIDINALDKYKNPPLKYAIRVCSLPFNDVKDIYIYLLQSGAKYSSKDVFGRSCLDYAEEFDRRREFIRLAEIYGKE